MTHALVFISGVLVGLAIVCAGAYLYGYWEGMHGK